LAYQTPNSFGGLVFGGLLPRIRSKVTGVSPKLQLKFDANQEHQLQAVDSVVRLFEGAPRFEAAFPAR
jgi:hypothetical protein